jgi:hypothetical protein
MAHRKVFCIGFHKTGTSSLHVALQKLGFRVCGAVAVNDPKIAGRAHELALALVPRYDAFRDNPWPLLYRRLDELFPNSLFIHTVRPPETWIKSVVGHFGGAETAMRKWIYGVGAPLGNEQIYLQRYDAHNVEVAEYFRGRSDQYLRLDITEDRNCWAKIGNFLRIPVPDSEFPWVNMSACKRLQRPASVLSQSN